MTWIRDPVDVYAFHVLAAAGVSTLTGDFDYLSPTSTDVGAVEISHNLMFLHWNEVVLYPAGYYARQIPVAATLTLPAGWQYSTALESAGVSANRVTFKCRICRRAARQSALHQGRRKARASSPKPRRTIGGIASGCARVFSMLAPMRYRTMNCWNFCFFGYCRGAIPSRSPRP